MVKQSNYIVRNSKIHGKGVFAKKDIRKESKIVEYTGKIVSRKEADDIGTTTVNGHTHTMLFTIDDDRVIDGNVGGDARFINHSCDPNSEAVQYDDDRIFIESLRPIAKGEEITYDYHLEVPGKITEKVKKEYECFCGSAKCRGTQIAASILEKLRKKEEKKKAKAVKEEKKKSKKENEKAKKDKKKSSNDKAKKDKKKNNNDAGSGLMVKKNKKSSSKDKSKKSKKDKKK